MSEIGEDSRPTTLPDLVDRWLAALDKRKGRKVIEVPIVDDEVEAE